MRLVRTNAAKWRLKPNAIGMMGFSAGGHLAAMVGMLAPPEARPDFLVLGYPAIPAALQVTASTPRTFLLAADDDTTVIRRRTRDGFSQRSARRRSRPSCTFILPAATASVSSRAARHRRRGRKRC